MVKSTLIQKFGIASVFVVIFGFVLKIILFLMKVNEIAGDILMISGLGMFVLSGLISLSIFAIKEKQYPVLLIWLVPITIFSMIFVPSLLA